MSELSLRIVLSRIRSLERRQKNNILAIIILVIATGLFFSNPFWHYALAQKAISFPSTNLEDLDPMERIGQGTLPRDKSGQKICEINPESGQSSAGGKKSPKEEEYGNLVKDHPIEVMVPQIAKKDKAVAAFIIGIAKKESDWGKHSPKKNGRDCYNYWGYRGTYNMTDSGYSCFDNPEQAVDVVGGRIEELINQKINTPGRMVVWKCGSSCAGHDPAGVTKWISDVASYYNKLNS